MKSFSKTFPAALDALLYKRGMNQVELADSAGVSQSLISSIIGESRSGRDDSKEAIAKALGTTYANMLALGELLLREQSGEELNLVDQHRKRILLGNKPLNKTVEMSWTGEPDPVPAGNEKPEDRARGLVVLTRDEERKEALEGNAADYVGVPLYESGRLAAGINGTSFDPYEKPASTVIVYRPEIRGRDQHNLRALRVGGDSMTPTIPEGAIVVIDLSDRIFAKRRIFCVNKIESGEYVASIKRVQKIFRGHLLLGDNPEYDAEATDMEWTDLCVGRVIWMWRNLENA